MAKHLFSLSVQVVPEHCVSQLLCEQWPQGALLPAVLPEGKWPRHLTTGLIKPQHLPSGSNVVTPINRDMAGCHLKMDAVFLWGMIAGKSLPK